MIKFTKTDDLSTEKTLETQEKPSKLQKLKEKIRQKKLEKSLQKTEEISGKNIEKVVKKRKRENKDVLSERFERLREKPEENEENDDFLVKKKGNQTHEIEQKDVGFSVSRRQLKKIKPEGHFEGRNKIKFDEIGNFGGF